MEVLAAWLIHLPRRHFHIGILTFVSFNDLGSRADQPYHKTAADDRESKMLSLLKKSVENSGSMTQMNSGIFLANPPLSANPERRNGSFGLPNIPVRVDLRIETKMLIYDGTLPAEIVLAPPIISQWTMGTTVPYVANQQSRQCDIAHHGLT